MEMKRCERIGGLTRTCNMIRRQRNSIFIPRHLDPRIGIIVRDLILPPYHRSEVAHSAARTSPQKQQWELGRRQARAADIRTVNTKTYRHEDPSCRRCGNGILPVHLKDRCADQRGRCYQIAVARAVVGSTGLEDLHSVLSPCQQGERFSSPVLSAKQGWGISIGPILWPDADEDRD